MNNIPDVTVKNLRVSGWGYGIYYYDQGVSLGRVEGCTIENNLFAGVVLYNKVHGVSVAGNRITGNVGRGDLDRGRDRQHDLQQLVLQPRR